MFKKEEPSSINDDILSQGFGRPGVPEDAVVIEASDNSAAPTSKKRKIQRALTTAAAGVVLLGIATAVVTLQNKPAAVDPAVDAVLNKPPTPLAAAKPAETSDAPNPAAAESVSASSAVQAAAAPAPTQPVAVPAEEKSPSQPVTPVDNARSARQAITPQAEAPAPAVAPSPAAEKPVRQAQNQQPALPAPSSAANVNAAPAAAPVQSPAPSQTQNIEKRLAALDGSYLRMVETLAKLAMRLDDLAAAQKEMKRDIDRQAKAQQQVAQTPQEKKAAPKQEAKAPAPEKKATAAAPAERLEKAVSMKELGILAMTTESVIFGPQGKEQEIFAGSNMPGLNGKLESVDPQNRTIVTSTRIYKVTH